MSKKDGFDNEILLTVPPDMYAKPTPLTGALYLTDIGYFPKAVEHYVERPEGCNSHILIICTSGEGWFDTGAGRRRVKAGEACILPSGGTHSYGSKAGYWWEIYWLHLAGEQSAELLKHLTEPPGGSAFACSMTDESMTIFSQICSSLAGEYNPVKYELICSRLWHLAGSLYSDSRSQSTNTSATVQECIRLMEEKLSTSLSLQELSERLSISSPYLCRMFKKETGHSPMEHYIHMKVRNACNLLDMTDLPVGEISRQIGIGDQYYFSRLFKKIMGVSPSGFRTRQK